MQLAYKKKRLKDIRLKTEPGMGEKRSLGREKAEVQIITGMDCVMVRL